MDLGLKGRRAFVASAEGDPGAACAAALAAEGAELLSADQVERADVVVAIAAPSPRGDRDALLTTAAMNDAWRESVAGTAELFQRALPHMKAQRHGRLIVIAPLAAKRETPGADMDNLVSLGLLGLYKTVSGEVGPYDITANAVLWDDQQSDDDPASVRESIAGAVAYLCSEPAAYITGVAIAVDSGRGPEVF